MKLSSLMLAVTLTGTLFTVQAHGADPVADAAKLATVEKITTKQEARAAQKESIKRARAAGELPDNEWMRNENTPMQVEGTRASRKVERQAVRASVKQQARAGGIPGANDEWESNQNTPMAVEGTRQERKAERKEVRDELKAANRRGEIPMVTEAGLGVGR